MTKTKTAKAESLDPRVIEFLARLDPMRPIASPGPGRTSDWIRRGGLQELPQEKFQNLYNELVQTGKISTVVYPMEESFYMSIFLFPARSSTTSWHRITRLKAEHGWVRVYEHPRLQGVRMYVATDTDDTNIYGVTFLIDT